MSTVTLTQAKRFLSALVVSIAGATGACSAADPGAPIGQRVGPTNGGGLTDNADASTATPDASSDLPDAGATPDASPMDASAASDVTDAPSGPAVLSFTLVNTSITTLINGSPVTGFDPIPNNSTISLGTVGATLSVRANLNVTTIGSVGFVYNGAPHTENATPYTMCGDDGAGTITDCAIPAGPLTVTATPYSLADLGGTPGTPLTITITVNP